MINATENFFGYEPNLECLERNLKMFSALKSGIEQIDKNGESSEKESRKKEVEVWLQEAQETEDLCQELWMKREMDNQKVPLDRQTRANEVIELNSRVEKLIAEAFGKNLPRIMPNSEECTFSSGFRDLNHLSQFTTFFQNQQHIHSYDIQVGVNNYYVGNVDEGKKLTLSECEGLSNCFWDDLTRLNNLRPEKLYTNSCKKVEFILTWKSIISKNDELGNLSRIEKLDLDRLDDLKSLIESNDHGEGEGVRSASTSAPPFPSLMPHGGIFSSLRQLSIRNCNKIKNLGLPLPDVQNIEYIGILCCEEIEEIIQVKATDEATLPKLVRLDLYGLPNLRSICGGTMICNSLKELKLKQCTSLKKLPFFKSMTCDPPPALSIIHMYE